jgi:hypothetical protein
MQTVKVIADWDNYTDSDSYTDCDSYSDSVSFAGKDSNTVKQTSKIILCNGWEHYVPYRCL